MQPSLVLNCGIIFCRRVLIIDRYVFWLSIFLADLNVSVNDLVWMHNMIPINKHGSNYVCIWCIMQVNSLLY
jgi:hypothetical protein